MCYSLTKIIFGERQETISSWVSHHLNLESADQALRRWSPDPHVSCSGPLRNTETNKRTAPQMRLVNSTRSPWAVRWTPPPSGGRRRGFTAPTVGVESACGHQTGSNCLPDGGRRGPTPRRPRRAAASTPTDSIIIIIITMTHGYQHTAASRAMRGRTSWQGKWPASRRRRQRTSAQSIRAVARAAARVWRDSWPDSFRRTWRDRMPSPAHSESRAAAMDAHQLRAGHWGMSRQYLHRIGRLPSPACPGCPDKRCPGAERTAPRAAARLARVRTTQAWPAGWYAPRPPSPGKIEQPRSAYTSWELGWPRHWSGSTQWCHRVGQCPSRRYA